MNRFNQQGANQGLLRLAAEELTSGKTAHALVRLYRNVMASPEDPQAWANLSAALLAEGDIERGRDVALCAIVRDPMQGAAWANFFTTEASTGRSSAPCVVLEALSRHASNKAVVDAMTPTLAQLPADAEELIPIAALLVQHGHVLHAHQILARAQKKEEAWRILALKCAYLQEDDAVVARLAPQALKARPDDADALRALIELAMHEGLDAAAITMGERLLLLGATELDQLKLAWALLREGRDTETAAVMDLVRTSRDVHQGNGLCSLDPGRRLFGIAQIAAWLVPASVGERRMAIALMAAEAWSEAVEAADAATMLVCLALEMEVSGFVQHAAAALVLADRYVPGVVDRDDAKRIGMSLHKRDSR